MYQRGLFRFVSDKAHFATTSRIPAANDKIALDERNIVRNIMIIEFDGS